MTIASMAMYPFPQLRSAYDVLWDAVRHHLSAAAPPLDWEVPADAAVRRPDLVLGQTCGWPLITELREVVRVVGTFDCDVEGSRDGTYCSVLVSRHNDALGDLLRRPGTTAAANGRDSLSGWISLQAAAAEEGVPIGTVLWTGSHAASLRALAEGRADVASIDAVSWAHLEHDGLVVIGHGPRVPCLPLVTSASAPDGLIGELRDAFAAAVGDPALVDACATLRIRQFVERGLADYEELSSLAPVG